MLTANTVSLHFLHFFLYCQPLLPLNILFPALPMVSSSLLIFHSSSSAPHLLASLIIVLSTPPTLSGTL